MFGPLLDAQASFRVAGAMPQWILHLVWVLQQFQERWQAWDILKKICKDACRMACVVITRDT